MDWSLRLLSNIMCSAGSFLFHRWLYGAADASALCLSGEPARSPFSSDKNGRFCFVGCKFPGLYSCTLYYKTC